MNSAFFLQPIYIDLLRQYHKPHKYRKLYLTFAILSPLLYIAILLIDFNWAALCMALIFGSNSYVFYSIATGKDPLGILGNSYLSMDELGIQYKERRRKVVEIRWQEVQKVELHLFSVDFELSNGRKENINLELLSDENLQLVKEQLRQMQTKV